MYLSSSMANSIRTSGSLTQSIRASIVSAGILLTSLILLFRLSVFFGSFVWFLWVNFALLALKAKLVLFSAIGILLASLSSGWSFLAQVFQSGYFSGPSLSGSVSTVDFSYFSTYAFLPNYGLLVYYAGISVFLALLLIALPLILKPSVPGFEKNSSYECGFEPFVCKNEVFESHFLVVGVLFLLFDLELIFLFPLGVVSTSFSLVVALSVVPFLLILLCGFIFEWVRGALLWPVFYAKRSSVF